MTAFAPLGPAETDCPRCHAGIGHRCSIKPSDERSELEATYGAAGLTLTHAERVAKADAASRALGLTSFEDARSELERLLSSPLPTH